MRKSHMHKTVPVMSFEVHLSNLLQPQSIYALIILNNEQSSETNAQFLKAYYSYTPIYKKQFNLEHQESIRKQDSKHLKKCLVQQSPISFQLTFNRVSFWTVLSFIMLMFYDEFYRLLDSLVVQCWLRVREVPGSIPSQGPRHTKDVIRMVPVVPLFSTEHSKGKILALSQELR